MRSRPFSGSEVWIEVRRERGHGCGDGAFAEYVVAGKAVARKPVNLSFEEAAAAGRRPGFRLHPRGLHPRRGAREAVFFIAKPGSTTSRSCGDLIEAGHVAPAIGQRFELGQIAEAMRAMDGHASAKIVITV